MSKPNGISRVKRKRKTESNNSDVKSKQMKRSSRQSENVFGDFDLTDLTFNQSFNPIKSVNKSFSHSMVKNNVSKTTGLTIDPNSSKQFKSESNPKSIFGDFDLSDLKCNQTSDSFTNVSKVFNQLVDRNDVSNSSDPKSEQLKSESNPKNVFEDFDLSDVTFDQNYDSIKSVSKAFSHLMGGNDVSKTVDNSTLLTIDSNSSKQFKSESNPKNIFGDFDLSDLKCNQTSDSFKNVSKVFNQLVDRNGVPNSSDLKCEQLKSESNNVFGDFDLSDWKCNETTDSLRSAGKPFTHLINRNDTSKTTDYSSLLTIDSNSRKQLKSESNPKNIFGDFDLSDLKCNEKSDSFRNVSKVFNQLIERNDVSNSSHPKSEQLKSGSNPKNVFENFDLSDLKCNETLDSFRSVSKVFNQLKSKTEVSKGADYSSLLTIDSKFDKSFSIPETMRKEIISNVFEDSDFNDFKFDESLPSFRNSRTAYQPMESTNIKCKTEDNIDWNDMFSEPFGESQNFRTSSPKPKFSSQRIKSSSPKPESKKSQEVNFSFEIDDKFFESYVDKTEHMTGVTENMTHDLESVKLEPESNDDCINSVKDISFSIRSDFETHNESTSQQFFSEITDKDFKKVDIKSELPFMGFRSGIGKLLHLSEEQLSRAKLIFADIEEWLIKEIIENKSQFKDCNSNINTYSQKFISNAENSGHKSVPDFNNLMQKESIDTFAAIMSSMFDNS